jgi:hypothetical protein
VDCKFSPPDDDAAQGGAYFAGEFVYTTSEKEEGHEYAGICTQARNAGKH